MMSITRMMMVSTVGRGKPGDEAEEDADDQRQRHHDAADEQRIARTVDEPRQEIAADGIGAEQEAPLAPVLPRWRPEQRIAVLRWSRHAGR